jgi:hypothetical protein
MKKSLLVVSSHRLSYFILQYLLKNHSVAYRNYVQFNELNPQKFHTYNSILISEPGVTNVSEKIKEIKEIYPGIKIIVTSSNSKKNIKKQALIDMVLDPMINAKNVQFLF